MTDFMEEKKRRKNMIEKKREMLKKALNEMNQNISYSENYGAWRPAYHDEPDGGNSNIYLSNFYGIAMHSVEIGTLSEEELDDLLR